MGFLKQTGGPTHSDLVEKGRKTVREGSLAEVVSTF